MGRSVSRVSLRTRRRQTCDLLRGFDVAHAPIDLARPEPNYNKTPGYTQEEIDGMTALLDAGFVDTWRHNIPRKSNTRGGVTGEVQGEERWVATGLHACEREDLGPNTGTKHPQRRFGSDHCPVSLRWRP